MAQKLDRVLIVGGGVGGMSAAIQLGALGAAIDLIDIDPDWRATGAGLTLNGATLRVFERLGVIDEVAAEGHIHGGRQTFDRAGNLLRELPAYKPSAGDLQASGGILRPVLHRILSSRVLATGAKVRLGMTVDELNSQTEKTEVLFSDGSRDRYDLVIGADGISSKVRTLAFPDAPAPKFTGQGCWRAVFDRPDDVQSSRLYVDRGHKLGFNPVSDKQMYMFLLETAEGNPWLEPSEWVQLLRSRMERFGGLPQILAQQLSPSSLVNYRPLETLLLAPPWHVGRIVLLGDAAHATTPHAGYGAGLSIEDGVVLADCIRDAAAVDQAMSLYEQRRFERCKLVLEGSLNVGFLEMSGAPIEEQIAASAALIEITRRPF
jgi:2-polyprenyl-6-methoxyphenol hydroxylase-like FAD-dependent oxidoreductase